MEAYNKSFYSNWTASKFNNNSKYGALCELKPDAKYNIVIVGKSGVGKSSLVNYLFDKKVQKVGTGKPVTEVGFHPADFMLKDLPVRLFDSWGLEADKADKWINTLNEELKLRQIDKDVTQWFHSIFYCIGAGGGRVEDFELDIIKKIIGEQYNVTILLTKADQAKKVQLDDITSLLKSEFSNDVVVIPVCSEEKVMIGGRKTLKFGKSDIEKQIPNSFWLSIIKRLPARCNNLIGNEITVWKNSMIEYINNNTGLFNQKNVYTHIQENGKKFANELQNNIVLEIIIHEISLILDMYNLFRKGLTLPEIKFYKDMDLGNTNVPYFDYKLDRIASIFAFIVMPVGIFFLKDVNKDNLNTLLSNFTDSLLISVTKLEPEIQKTLVEISSIH